MRFILRETRNNLDSAEVRCELSEHAIIRSVIRLLPQFLQAIEGLLTSVRCDTREVQSSTDDVVVSFQAFEWHRIGTAILELRNQAEVTVTVTVDILLNEVNLVLAKVQRSQGICTCPTEGFKHFFIGRVHILVDLQHLALGCALATGNHTLDNLREVLARRHLVKVHDSHHCFLGLLRHLTEDVQHLLESHHLPRVGNFAPLKFPNKVINSL